MGEYRYKLPDIGEGVVEATIELTAPVSGVIKMVACEEGDILAVGADLVVFETDEDEIEESAVQPASQPAKPLGQSTYAFKLPDIGEGVVEAEITAWHVAIGDEVEEDAPIADAMTDKATKKKALICQRPNRQGKTVK